MVKDLNRRDSILGPLRINILINHLFLFIETITLCNYANDYCVSTDKNTNIVISRLRHGWLCNKIRMVL